MKCKCAQCGKEIDSYWARKRNSGRKVEYYCDKRDALSLYNLKCHQEDCRKLIMRGKEKRGDLR